MRGMYCKTRYRVRDLNSLSSQDLGGGGESFTLPGVVDL